MRSVGHCFPPAFAAYRPSQWSWTQTFSCCWQRTPLLAALALEILAMLSSSLLWRQSGPILLALTRGRSILARSSSAPNGKTWMGFGGTRVPLIWLLAKIRLSTQLSLTRSWYHPVSRVAYLVCLKHRALSGGALLTQRHRNPRKRHHLLLVFHLFHCSIGVEWKCSTQLRSNWLRGHSFRQRPQCQFPPWWLFPIHFGCV